MIKAGWVGLCPGTGPGSWPGKLGGGGSAHKCSPSPAGPTYLKAMLREDTSRSDEFCWFIFNLKKFVLVFLHVQTSFLSSSYE